jgi:hypothetical protein
MQVECYSNTYHHKRPENDVLKFLALLSRCNTEFGLSLKAYCLHRLSEKSYHMVYHQISSFADIQNNGTNKRTDIFQLFSPEEGKLRAE